MSDNLGLKYDELYDKATSVLEKYNPCKIQNGTCHGFRANGLDVIQPPIKCQFCCHGCAHLGPSGCTVKALYCKVWLCHTAGQCNPECREELASIERQAAKYNLLHARASKSESLERAARRSTILEIANE